MFRHLLKAITGRNNHGVERCRTDTSPPWRHDSIRRKPVGMEQPFSPLCQPWKVDKDQYETLGNS